MEHRCLSPWRGAVAGGLIAFAWSAFSWTVLPFHGMTFSPFGDPAALVNVLATGSPRSGVFILANDPKGQTAPTDPFVLVSYKKEGAGSNAAALALGLLLQMTGAFFWTWILGKIPGLTVKDSALCGLFFGLGVGALGILPGSVCWHLPWAFTATQVVDAAIAWTAASMVLSRCYAPACPLPKRP
ncbi:MAG: hypothetical protein HYV14_11220 [Elusimicrobia bacterium]|nr:hypothetical protein [Elusimicrobiota bacterium]